MRTLAVSAILLPTTDALSQTWDGGGTNNNWSTSNNWNPNAVPVNNGTANVTFSGNTRLTPNLNVNYNVNSVTFSSTAGSFVLGGSRTLTIQGGGVLSSATVAETINNNIVLGANQTWTVSNASGPLTAGGVISGSSSLNKAGAGTLILNGANTYSGGTTVSAGILQGTTTSVRGTIVNNANVTFNQSTSGTYSGNMSGTGSLTKSGTGTVTLSGTNTYSGGTTVSGGSLAGTTSSLQGTITNNANVTFNQSTSGTYSGNISGTGSLTKSGTGTVTLSGTNTYSGGTTVSGGSLIGNTASLQGNIANSANVTFNQTTNGAYAGNMNGSGNLTKSGAGTLTLNGTNTYTGGTTVSGGAVVGTTSSVQGAITNNSNVTFDQSTSGTYSGSMSGTGSLTKSGTGTVTLSGTNTYTGGTTVSSGSLVGTTSSVQGAITNNANVTFNQSTSGTYSGNMSGTGSLIKSGTGTVTLSGTNTYTGGTTVSGGSLAGTTNNLLGAITNNANVTFNQSTGGTYAGDMSGTGSLTKSGTGAVTLSGTNTYTGGTTVSGGSLVGDTSSLQGNISNSANVKFDQTANGTYAGNVSGTGNVTKTGAGTLTLSGTNSYSGGTTVSGGSLAGTTTSLQGAITNNANVTFDQNTSGTYAGVMSGIGGLTKSGVGTLTLSGTNTYTGGTTISGGSLVGTTTSLQGAITNNANVTFNQSTSGSYSGNMSGTGSLTKSGTGTVTLSGTNSYTGGTTITAGTLQVGAGGSVADNQALTVNGGTFNLNGSNLAVSSLSGTGGAIALGSGSLTVDDPNSSSYAGAISGTGSLTKSGAGTLLLTGTNTYSGGTTVSGGSLAGTTSSLQGAITNNANVTFNQSTSGTYAGNMSGTGSLTKSGTGTVTLSGTNSYTGGTTVTSGSLIGTTSSLQGAVSNNANVTFNQSTSGTYAGVMSGTGSLTKSGTGTVTLGGANTYTGGTTVTSGILQGDTTSLQGSIVDNANITFNQTTDGTYAGVISGTGNVTKSGTGTVTFSGANTYTGGTTVAGGTLRGDTTSLRGSITNNAAVVLDQASDGTYSGNMSGTGNLTKSGTGTVTLSGTNSYTGGTTVSEGSLVGTTSSLQRAITNNANVTFSQNTSGTYSGAMTGTGSLTKIGSGQVTLSSANTYTGGTTVNGGALVGNTTSLQGAIVNNANVTFNQSSGGTYAGSMSGTGSLTKSGTGALTLSGTNAYSGGTTVTGGSLIGNTTSLQGNIANSANVNFDQTADGTYSGNISGTGSLTKGGAGTLTLGGTNSYSGGTTVSGGSLVGNTTNLQGNIANSGNVTFDQAVDGAHTGNISGTGSLIKSGAGTLTLSGSNSYTGGTTVAQGTLKGTTSSIQRAITNNGNVTFDQSTSGTYGGAMSGTGSLTKQGTGTVTLSGINSYSGGTTVSGGSLVGNTTSLQGSIVNDANVTFNQSASGTYAGVMSGSGSLTKIGTGTVALNGANTYSGGTTVTGGSLQGDSTSLQGDIFNDANVVFDQAFDGSYAGTMSGSGGLSKQGAGTLALSGPNTYAGGTSVLGGALQGDTTSLQGNFLNDANVTFNQVTNGIYAGTMSGAGSLSKTGAGVLTLSGPNTYSGGSQIAEGTLQGDTVSLQGNFLNDGTLAFDQSFDGVFAGAISGTGSLIKDGAGVLTLTGVNSYTGGTQILTGALQGDATSLQGDILNNASVVFDQSSDGTYGGSLTGTGSLLKSGSGILTLSGANSYSGGTSIVGGTLIGDTTSLQGNIANDGHVTFAQVSDGTFAGTITGTGSLSKTGGGSLFMSGANTYTGLTTVEEGRLAVNGSLTSDMLVEADGTLEINGQITGNVVNHGTLAAGHSIGSLTVNGEYTQEIGSHLSVEANDVGTTPGVNNDLIAVNGTAVLNGGSVEVDATPGTYHAGMQYTFLTADSGVTGTFASISDNLALFDAQLGYTANSAFFTWYLVPTDFAAVAQTPNELAVATYLDTMSTNATGDFADVLTGLGSLPDDEIRDALNQMGGEVFGSLSQTSFQSTTLVVAQLSQGLRSGSFHSEREPMAVAAPEQKSSPIRLVGYSSGRHRPPVIVFVRETPRDQWTGWSFGLGLGGSAKSDGNATGLDYALGGTLLGVERRLADNERIGLFGGYLGTQLNTTGINQTGSIQSGQFGGYDFHDDGFNYYLLIGGMQVSGYDTQRYLQFDGVNRVADGNFSGWQGYGYLERGVRWQTSYGQVQPYAALQYIYLRQNAFTESGADSLNLDVAGLDANSLRSLLGTRLQLAEISRGDHRWLPELRALWLHEFLNTTSVVNSFFAPVGGQSFAVQGLDLGRDWAILGTGLRWELPGGWSLYGNYDAQVNSQQVFHVGSGGAQFNW